ncbi:hypothetical protein [Microbacterium sulfonylureivorans]|uniref:hypothetical protein n=1 Tax=Microbacterium sulfonylureivorans TaxID=2486854 RepID=UPI00197B49DB|nr:hypothetical protein [Microbacterium sulfonylureivorans]
MSPLDLLLVVVAGVFGLAIGSFLSVVVGGIVGLALIAARRAGRKTAIPFGPFMLTGAWTGVFAGEALGHAHISLYSGN